MESAPGFHTRSGMIHGNLVRRREAAMPERSLVSRRQGSHPGCNRRNTTIAGVQRFLTGCRQGGYRGAGLGLKSSRQKL